MPTLPTVLLILSRNLTLYGKKPRKISTILTETPVHDFHQDQCVRHGYFPRERNSLPIQSMRLCREIEKEALPGISFHLHHLMHGSVPWPAPHLPAPAVGQAGGPETVSAETSRDRCCPSFGINRKETGASDQSTADATETKACPCACAGGVRGRSASVWWETEDPRKTEGEADIQGETPCNWGKPGPMHRQQALCSAVSAGWSLEE